METQRGLIISGIVTVHSVTSNMLRDVQKYRTEQWCVNSNRVFLVYAVKMIFGL